MSQDNCSLEEKYAMLSKILDATGIKIDDLGKCNPSPNKVCTVGCIICQGSKVF